MYLEAFQQPVSNPQSFTEQIPFLSYSSNQAEHNNGLPAGAVSLRQTWRLEMLNSSLFRNGESQHTKYILTSVFQP